MGRRIFIITSVLSLLLCVATVALWVVSFRYADFTDAPVLGTDSISSNAGGTTQLLFPDPYKFPYWFPILCFAVLPVIATVRWMSRLTDVTAGHCCSCSYNLTGNTSGVCPECGNATTPTSLADSAKTGTSMGR